MFRSRFEVTRREFIKTAASAAFLPSIATQPSDQPVTLPNGIVLPRVWPPRRGEWIGVPETPPYLQSPPAVIPIDVGRQLFVDDFLIDESALYRRFHAATYHGANPILKPERAWEQTDPQASIAGDQPSPSAMVFSDGVFYDPYDRLFKMWYMAGYQDKTALAVSGDGINWERPSFDIESGTNIVSIDRRDSNTIWLDVSATDAQSRYKMAAYDLGLKAMRLSESADGIHWRSVGTTGPCGDRSTFFRNPFRNVWAFSLRHDVASLNRTRRYAEAADFGRASWTSSMPVPWIGTDALDRPHPSVPATRTELYNLDAVAYESLFIGLFDVYRGEPVDREKPNDLCIGFSRDGFHWSRLWRDPFISVSETKGAWNHANVQSAGGCCVIAGDRLHFYVSGRQGIAGTSLPGVSSTGLAMLRRDGFASLTDQWPSGVARAITTRPGTLTTRPLRYNGSNLFVNAEVTGVLRAEVLDVNGRPIDGFTLDKSARVIGNGTRMPLNWRGRLPRAARGHPGPLPLHAGTGATVLVLGERIGAGRKRRLRRCRGAGIHGGER